MKFSALLVPLFSALFQNASMILAAPAPPSPPGQQAPPASPSLQKLPEELKSHISGFLPTTNDKLNLGSTGKDLLAASRGSVKGTYFYKAGQTPKDIVKAFNTFRFDSINMISADSDVHTEADFETLLHGLKSLTSPQKSLVRSITLISSWRDLGRFGASREDVIYSLIQSISQFTRLTNLLMAVRKVPHTPDLSPLSSLTQLSSLRISGIPIDTLGFKQTAAHWTDLKDVSFSGGIQLHDLSIIDAKVSPKLRSISLFMMAGMDFSNVAKSLENMALYQVEASYLPAIQTIKQLPHLKRLEIYQGHLSAWNANQWESFKDILVAMKSPLESLTLSRNAFPRELGDVSSFFKQGNDNLQNTVIKLSKDF